MGRRSRGRAAHAPAGPDARGTSPTQRSLVARAAVPIGLALLCLVAYSNAFGAGFVLDSRQLILNDPRVHALTSGNLSLIAQHTYWWPYGESGLYRPLTTLTYLLDFAILGHGDHPAGYHWVNLLLHVANTWLAWALVARVTRDDWTAAAAAAIWAVIPLSTEAVTNIAGRADLLAAFFSLAAVLLYARARNLAGLPMGVAALGVGLAVLAGVLSKESAIASVGVLVAYEWHDRRSTNVRALASCAGTCGLLLAAWAWQRGAVLSASGTPEFPFTDNPIVGAGMLNGRLTAVQVAWRYVALLAWPAHLSNDYSYAQIAVAQGTVADWVGVMLLGGGVIAALWQLRDMPRLLFFALFTIITFLPASNLLFATGTIMGERLMYLPSLGLAALLAVGLRALAMRRRANPQAPASRMAPVATTALVAALVVAYGARTYARNADWASDVTLWRSAVAAAPASAKAHRALAEALYDSDPAHGNIDEVIASADRSVALLDQLPDEQNTFQAFRQAGAYYVDKANMLSASSAPGTVSPEVRGLYARALHLLDRAVLIARAGAARVPGASLEPEADAQRLRAAAILGMENPPLALVAANRARDLSPSNPLAYQLAAAALMAMTRGDDAAIALLTGSIVSGDRGLGAAAMSLYQSGLDTEGCAITATASGAALNPRCPIVQRHSCAATADAVQIVSHAGQRARAEQLAATAVAELRCPKDLMDRALAR
jgi:tetratricopeptide (TPR) repeat protein